MWLDVWSLNKRAIRFYSQWGFETFGRQPFRLGNDIQEDLLMARPVARPGASSRVLGPDRMDAFASTPRLDLVPVTDSFEPEQLLPVFNSNPEFLTASGYSSQFNRAEIEAYLMEETLAENALSLLVRLREDGRLIGTVAIQSPNPTDGLPWIGLLLIDSSDQRKGYGAEAAQALEARFAAEGRRAVRLFALRDNEGAKAFWESLGYRAVSESRDAHGRGAWLMEKHLRKPA
jgi:RimJ/RimL family protein N-acetyltransferase